MFIIYPKFGIMLPCRAPNRKRKNESKPLRSLKKKKMTDKPPTMLHIRVTPKAARNMIKTEPQADGTLLYRVYVTCPPEDGKANKEVIKLLAKHLGLSKSSLSLQKGAKGRDKIIAVTA